MNRRKFIQMLGVAPLAGALGFKAEGSPYVADVTTWILYDDPPDESLDIEISGNERLKPFTVTTDHQRQSEAVKSGWGDAPVGKYFNPEMNKSLMRALGIK